MPDETPTVLKGLVKFERDPKLLKNFDTWFAGLKSLCPDVDLPYIVREAHQWLLDKEGTRQGNKSAYKPFLTRWAKRAQADVDSGRKPSVKAAKATGVYSDELPDPARYA